MCEWKEAACTPLPGFNTGQGLGFIPKDAPRMLFLLWCLLLYSFWPKETLASSGYCVGLVSQRLLKCFHTDLLDTSAVDSWVLDGHHVWMYRRTEQGTWNSRRWQDPKFISLGWFSVTDWLIDSFIHILGTLQCCGQGLSEILWKNCYTILGME